MPRNEEYDWIFDYTLQFLESDKFDASLMNFVDEKCLVFEDTEENKLIYTDIHREFCEHLEALISSNLSEVGITTELFLESCEKARSGRDINSTVFERLMAMEDFTTFKKLMTKRNIELQLESIRSFMATTNNSNKQVSLAAEAKTKEATPKKRIPDEKKSGEDKQASFKGSQEEEQEDYMTDKALSQLEKDEIEALQCFALGDADFDNMSEEEIQELLLQSLVEMEWLHRHEELEHAELERALLLSLAQEEERLASMILQETTNTASSTAASEEAEAKPAITSTSSPSKEVQAHTTSVVADAKESVSSPSVTSVSSAKDETAVPAPKLKAPLAPLAPLSSLGGLKLRGEAKPLPSISHNHSANVEAAAQELEMKRRQAEKALQESAQQLQAQRRQETHFRDAVVSQGLLDPAEAQRRAEHMQRQRDLLLAKKKADRAAKLETAAADAKKSETVSTADAKMVAQFLAERDAEMKDDNSSNSNNNADLKRQNLRLALARRLKSDIRQEEMAKQVAAQETQFAELDTKLRQVEEMREEHRKRELLLAKQLEKQKEQIARNIELSAAALKSNNN